MPPSAPIKIGISSCLLGENVRYDGRNKYNAYIVEILSQYVELIPVCPEVAIGLGVPRPPVELLTKDGEIHATSVDDPNLDISDQLEGFGKQQATRLNYLCGYIFKSKSPSCGISDTHIITDNGETRGTGLYARQIMEAHPHLPVIDETSLEVDSLRTNFLEHIFALARWHQLLHTPLSLERLRKFHKIHTPELSRHSDPMNTDLSDFLSVIKEPVSIDMANNFFEKFMAILKIPVPGEGQLQEFTSTHDRLTKQISNHAPSE